MKNILSREEILSRVHPRQEDVRGHCFRDQTAIIHSMPFRRLKHKTQAFFAPSNDHACTRIEHVLHVATIAGTIMRGLAHNDWDVDTELAYAAGLGHDLGHAPFGHTGEAVLSKLVGGEGFSHELHSLRVVDHLARDGHGLNLVRGVRDAIVCHNGEKYEQYLMPMDTRLPEQKTNPERLPATLEGCAVRFADKIAYLGRDVEDALRAGFFRLEDMPEQLRRELGSTNGDIINTLVLDLIETSIKNNKLGWSDDKFELVVKLGEFNTKNIYRHPKMMSYQKYCQGILEVIYEHLSAEAGRFFAGSAPGETKLDEAFARYLTKMQDFYRGEGADMNRMLIDYIAGMTDSFALEAARQIIFPEPIPFN